MRAITKLKVAMLLGVALVGLFVTAERVYLVNGAQYPRFLATDVGAVRFEDLDGLRVGSCNGEPVEVYPKTGYWVLRCSVAYFEGCTFISHTDPFAPSNHRESSL